MQISKIVKAWAKVVQGITTEEDKRRANVCANCEHAVYKPYLDFINDELTEVKGMVCGLCNCPLLALIRSSDNCKKNKW